MTRTGIVESVCDGRVRVVLADASCDGCETPCGACSRKTAPQRAEVPLGDLAVSVGDRVELSCPSHAVVLYSILFFLLPILIALCVCMLLWDALGQGTAALVGALCALVWFFVAGLFLSKSAAAKKNDFVLSRVLVRYEDTKRT